MNKHLAFWVATSAIPGVGTATFNYLLKYFKTLKNFWEAPSETIYKLKIDAKTRQAILDFRNEVSPRIYLDKVFESLSISLEKESELKSRIRGALVYPALLLVMAVVILTFLVTFALPKIAEVFVGGGIEPPLFSRIVFGIGLFLNQYIWLILGLAVLILGFGGFLMFKSIG